MKALETESAPGANVRERAAGVPVISVSGLRKSYGEHEVVAGIDLEVRRGEVFAFLGPNGAGKTTTVEILEGYRSRSAGEVRVLEEDPASADGGWRSRIGLVLQSCTMPAELTVRELVELYAGYYPHPRGVAETIELVGLADKRDARTDQLSGGQLRRLDVALALIGDPELVFLDEPTTGFDPSARHHAWEVIAESARARQDDLPDHALHGRGAGPRRPRRGDRRGGDRRRGHARDARRPRPGMSDVSFSLPAGTVLSELPERARVGRAQARRRAGPHRRRGARPRAVCARAVGAGEGEGLDDLTVGRPTLEDIYLRLDRWAGAPE